MAEDHASVLDVPDPEPFSPSIFLDLPPTPPYPDAEELPSSGDLVLPFISRMLMEEDIDDGFFCQYPDHPTLLTVQQPFSQILSDAVATTALSSSDADSNISEGFQPPQLEDVLVSAFFNGEDADMLNLAFRKGMEEGNKFLTANNCLLIDKPLLIRDSDLSPPGFAATGQPNKEDASMAMFQASVHSSGKKRRNQPDDLADEMGRSSKLMVSEQEETDDMVDKIILNGFDWCLRGMKSTMGGEVDKNTKKKKNGRSAQGDVGDLHTLLIHCAQAVGTNDRQSATQLLRQIKKHSSPTGDADQRLAHCFAEGLEARLVGMGSQVYRSLLSKRTSVMESVKAYQLYLEACCFKSMAFEFSNSTIFSATSGRKKVHIVDYGMDFGFQWPTLLHRFAREGRVPEVRITSIDLPQPGFRPSSQIQETGRPLSSCGLQFGVPFKYQSVAANWETIRADDLNIDPDEVLIINSLNPFGNLMDEGVVIDSPSPRDVVLNNIRKMQPDVFILCIMNGSYNIPFFITRFREALSYYSAMFDMLDATTPRDDNQRLLIELDLLGRCALNVIACEGLDRVERPKTYKQWQVRNHRAGLRQLPLDPEITKDVREKVKSLYHKDFVIDMDHQWLLEGWKGRILYAMSTWVA